MSTRANSATRPTGCRPRDRAFDEAFGTKLKFVRASAGVSQERLGTAVGITFQQVQKYEKGKDRVAVATMVAMAKALGVRPEVFLDEEPAPAATGLVALREDAAMARRFGRIADGKVRKTLGALIEALAPRDAKEERSEDES